MEIEEYSLLNQTQQADGSNLAGKVLIPNPTVFEIEMVILLPSHLPPIHSIDLLLG